MPSGWPRARASNSRRAEPVGLTRRALLQGTALAAGFGFEPAGARAQGVRPALGEPPLQPFLRIEAVAHTAPVARLAADASGRLLASVSDDKTLRLWDLADGALRAVLRPPIATEAEG